MTDQSYRVDVDLVNNTFDGNYASLYGAAFTAEVMQYSQSTIQIVNNMFKNNYCLNQGGVFAFVSTSHQIIATNNTYFNNHAEVSGGVGYVLFSKLLFNESVAVYKGINSTNTLLLIIYR